MLKVNRYDRGTLNKPVRMANGWLRVDGFIGRSGILEYARADGSTWREYRPADEAFRADALESFAGVPFTNNHPAGLLTAENTKEHQAGTVEQPVRDGERMRARILITDADTVKAAEAGKAELSCGYTCELELTPGTAPDGQRYDAIQRAIVGNHVALVDVGRAGPQFRLRLDNSELELVESDSQGIGSARATPAARGEMTVKKVRIDGVEVEVSELAAQLIEKAEKSTAEIVAKFSADTKAATADVEKQRARADLAEADLKKAKAELATAPEKAKAEMKARVELEAQASKVLGEEKFDGRTDLEIKRAVVEKVLSLKLDGKTDAYVEASFELAMQKEAQPAEPETKEIDGEKHEDGTSKKAPTGAEIAEQMRKRTREAYRTAP